MHVVYTKCRSFSFIYIFNNHIIYNIGLDVANITQKFFPGQLWGAAIQTKQALRHSDLKHFQKVAVEFNNFIQWNFLLTD